MNVKDFKTWDEQIAKLVEHGCTDISSGDYARDILQRVNYYRLTAYFLPFRDAETKKYDSAKVSLEKIYSLYAFDAELRLLLLAYLEDIELYFRTQIAYHHALQYGALGYQEAENFNKYHQHEVFDENVEQVRHHRRTSLIYQHHKRQYNGQFPIWVLVEFFSFGMTSKFFADLPTALQQAIAKQLDLKSSQVRTYLEAAVVLRNICAHYGRLYYTSFSKIPGQLPAFMTDNIKLKSRLMAQIYALKMLYPRADRWNEDFIPALEALLKKYQAVLHLHHIGFTDDWRELLKKA